MTPLPLFRFRDYAIKPDGFLADLLDRFDRYELDCDWSEPTVFWNMQVWANDIWLEVE